MADTYTVACDRCYSWHRTGLGKKLANIEAVGHMNMNPGHSCSLIKEDKKTRGGKVESNPPHSGQTMSRHVIAVIYRNVSDSSDVVRVHGFGNADIELSKARGGGVTIRGLEDFPDVRMIAEPDGSVRLIHKNPGTSLWQEFK
jgi:hypothetical protein